MLIVNDHHRLLAGAHYFTRNRTRGSDFPLFSPCSGSPTIVSRCFRLLFGSRKGLLFVVGQVRFLVKPTFFWLAVCLRDWKDTRAPDLLGKGGSGQQSTKRVYALLRIGTLTGLFATSSHKETWLFGERTHRYASLSLTSLSGLARAAQASGSALPAIIPGPENASAGFISCMDGLYPQICH